jgi:MFS family permease
VAFVAIPWFVLQTTGSAAKTGLTGGAFLLAAVGAGVVGPVVDRLGFKRASIVADLAGAVTVALIPLIYHTIGLIFWQLLAAGLPR